MTLPIVERLRRTAPGYRGTLRDDGTVEYAETETESLVNPDGPEAADTIEELVEALRRSNKIARALARGHLAFPDDVAALNASDALLAKIGGAA
jgi:hypothetical protein